LRPPVSLAKPSAPSRSLAAHVRAAPDHAQRLPKRAEFLLALPVGPPPPRRFRRQAEAALDPLYRAVADLTVQRPAAEYRVQLQSASRGIAELEQRFGRPLWVLAGITGLVLLMACSNIATCCWAAPPRAPRRWASASPSARPRRIARQLLTESLLLSALGTVAALALAPAARAGSSPGPPPPATGVSRSPSMAAPGVHRRHRHCRNLPLRPGARLGRHPHRPALRAASLPQRALRRTPPPSPRQMPRCGATRRFPDPALRRRAPGPFPLEPPPTGISASTPSA